MKKEDIKVNEPTLFINTVDDKKTGNENQEIFDSRTNKRKKHALYRLDDIKAMLLYKINILCEVKTKEDILEGYILEVKDDQVVLKISSDITNVNIGDIEDINILEI